MVPEPPGPFLEMRGIVKRFPGVVALSGVDFDVRPCEVHVLLGENFQRARRPAQVSPSLASTRTSARSPRRSPEAGQRTLA
jgi:hypothetical protein